MIKPRLEVMQVDSNTIKNAVSEAMKENFDPDAMNKNFNPETIRNVVEETTKSVLAQQKEEELKQKHIDKLLKKEVMTDKVKDKHEHKDSCPNCKSKIKDFGDGIHICEGEGCGVTILDKAAKFVVCDGCDAPIPESFVGTKKSCPHCGSTKAHYHNKTKK